MKLVRDSNKPLVNTILDDKGTTELVYINNLVYAKDGDKYYATKKAQVKNKDNSTTFNFKWDDEKPLKLEDIQ